MLTEMILICLYVRVGFGTSEDHVLEQVSQALTLYWVIESPGIHAQGSICHLVTSELLCLIIY